MVLLYSRVSTGLQSNGLEAQGRALRAYCANNGIVEYFEFSDEGVSGAKINRPGLDKLMEEVRKGHVKSVIVYSFSRFARSVRHLLDALETFEKHGCTFISISEQLNTKTSTGKFVFSILAALAALERDLIRERVSCGLANARAKGKQIGRPKVIRKGDLISELSSQKLSHRRIAELIGCSAATVCRELKRVAKG